MPKTLSLGLAKLLKDFFGTSMVPGTDDKKIKWTSHFSGIRGLLAQFLVKSFLACKVTFIDLKSEVSK